MPDRCHCITAILPFLSMACEEQTPFKGWLDLSVQRTLEPQGTRQFFVAC